MVTTDRIVSAAEIDRSYSPGGSLGPHTTPIPAGKIPTDLFAVALFQNCRNMLSEFQIFVNF